MSELSFKASATQPDRRTHPRFRLHYPVHVNFSGNGIAHEIQAVTENVSTGGVLLASSELIPPKSAVEFVISVRKGLKVFGLKSAGRVVWAEQQLPEEAFRIAIQCKRPIQILTNPRSPLL
jgi:PilZ domain